MSIAMTTAMSATLWVVLGCMGYFVVNIFAQDDANRKKFILIYICVGIISDIICTTLLAQIYSGDFVYEFIRFLVATSGTVITIASINIVMGVRYEKLFFVVCVVDAWRFLCCYASGAMIWLVSNQYAGINEFYVSEKLNWGRLIGVVIFAIALIIPVKRFATLLAKHRMKYPAVGRGLIIVYFFCVLIRNIVPVSQYGIVILPEVTIAVIIMSVLSIYTFQYENNKMSARVDMMEYEKRVMSEYCDALDSQISQTKKIRHDFRNNFQVVWTLCENGEYEELKRYLREWQDNIDEAKIKKYCDVQIVNASIAQKEKICKEQGIRLEVEMSGIDRGAISEFDLTTIIYNLLDNAIIGCKAVDREERFISLRCKSVYNQLVIIVKNSCNTDKPYKRTDDDVEHGIGLTIVNSIVKKYDGSVNVEDKKNLYRVDINLNVQPAK